MGVTGSVGKTTTKDMIALVVAQKYKTLKTQGNLNNEIGMPKTLFGLDKDTQAAVIEMGMSARELRNTWFTFTEDLFSSGEINQRVYMRCQEV